MRELKTSVYPMCPCCGNECEKVYRDIRSRMYVGCDVCLTEIEAWKCYDCFPCEDDE